MGSCLSSSQPTPPTPNVQNGGGGGSLDPNQIAYYPTGNSMRTDGNRGPPPLPPPKKR